MKSKLSFLFAMILLSSCQHSNLKSSVKSSEEKVILSSEIRSELESAQATGKHFAVATQGIYATKAAEQIKALGGNIIDSAIAASFVISVERPHSTGIGGGGFFIYRDGRTKKTYAVDFRERAPLKARKTMYLDDQGQVIPRKSIDGHLAVAVPGLVAGLLEIHQRFGRLPLKTVMAPAIDLAEKGFPVYKRLALALSQRADQLRKDEAASRIFLKFDGQPLEEGALLQQKDLAETLRQISRNGKKSFYQGRFAKSLLKAQKANGGLISQADLNSYKVRWRKPLQSKYKQYEIFSMPPPSSGGIHVIQFLKMLEDKNLNPQGPYSAENLHLQAATLQSAFADRAKYLGDPDFVKVPIKELISEKYLQKRFAEIPTQKARSANEVSPGQILRPEHTETTHLSLMDDLGNAVATTQTINGFMGAAVVAPGTGVVLNNEMDDFSAQPGTANLFGAIGGEANSIAPKKTPLSSMSPTLLFLKDQPVLSVGAPGGTRIISCVAQTIHNLLEYKMNLFNAIAAVRYHHQWRPDILFIDPPGPGSKATRQLQKMGYQVQIEAVPCNVMAVSKLNGPLEAVSDPRDIGTSFAE